MTNYQPYQYEIIPHSSSNPTQTAPLIYALHVKPVSAAFVSLKIYLIASSCSCVHMNICNICMETQK
jgi:hypothetical protein